MCMEVTTDAFRRLRLLRGVPCSQKEEGSKIYQIFEGNVRSQRTSAEPEGALDS